MDKSTIHAGLLGLGHAASHHARALHHVPGIELSAVCDLDPKRYHELDLSPGFQSLDAMLAESRLDLVIVATPNADHLLSVSRLLNAGVDVVVEKPAAETREDLQTMLDLADARTRYLHVALHSAFGEEVVWLRDNLDAVVGDRALTGFHCELFDPYIEAGLLRPGVAGLGGSWIDCGVNALSVLAEFIDPETLRVDSADFARDASLNCSETGSDVRFTFGGCGGRIETDWTRGVDRKVTYLTFDDVDVVLHHSNEEVLVRKGDNEERLFAVKTGLPRLTNHYVGVFRDLAARYPAQDNLELATTLHRLVFDVQDAA